VRVAEEDVSQQVAVPETVEAQLDTGQRLRLERLLAVADPRDWQRPVDGTQRRDIVGLGLAVAGGAAVEVLPLPAVAAPLAVRALPRLDTGDVTDEGLVTIDSDLCLEPFRHPEYCWHWYPSEIMRFFYWVNGRR
jgi:hypothetical protein